MKRWVYLILALTFVSAGEASAQNPLEALKLKALNVTRERPLFQPTRRPPPPAPVASVPPPAPVAAAAAPAPAPAPFELIGSAVGGGAAFALLRNRTTNAVVKTRPGDEADGWRIVSIGERSVALERDGRTESLALAARPATPLSAEAARTESVAAAPPSLLTREAARKRPQP